MESEIFLRNFCLPKNWTLKLNKGKSPELLTDEALVFRLDYLEKKKLNLKQPLAKAIGFKGTPLVILDVTAGWGQDAFLLSQWASQVIAIEQDPFVFHFVQVSHLQKPIFSPSLKFVLDNSLNYLKNIKEYEKPDVIYMDPMFGEKKKSLSRKPLRVLKALVGESVDKEKLFQLSLEKAKNRIVVKRHRLDPPFVGNRLCSFKGHSVCYDVFASKKEK